MNKILKIKKKKKNLFFLKKIFSLKSYLIFLTNFLKYSNRQEKKNA